MAEVSTKIWEISRAGLRLETETCPEIFRSHSSQSLRRSQGRGPRRGPVPFYPSHSRGVRFIYLLQASLQTPSGSALLAAASAASIAAAASVGTASVLPAVSCSSASRFVRRIALSTAAGRSARHRVRTSAARPPSELAVFAHLRREAVQRCVARGPQRGGRDTPPAGHGRPVRRATVCAACGCGPAARARSGRARPAR